MISGLYWEVNLLSFNCEGGIMHYIIIAFSVISILLPSISLAECLSGNCKDGVGVIELFLPYYNKEILIKTYAGSFKNFEFDGSGKLIIHKEGYYQGEFSNSRFNGKGKLVSNAGNYWEGDWIYNERKNGEIYIKFKGKEYIIHDDSTMTQDKEKIIISNNTPPFYTFALTNVGRFFVNISSSKIQVIQTENINLDDYLPLLNFVAGCISGDCQYGNGTCVYLSGTTYKGDFTNNKFNGEGEIVFYNGIKYKGSFSNGFFEGQGELTLPNGNYYEGDFYRHMFHGFGRLVMTNEVLEGQFVNGLYRGSSDPPPWRRYYGEAHSYQSPMNDRQDKKHSGEGDPKLTEERVRELQGYLNYKPKPPPVEVRIVQ